MKATVRVGRGSRRVVGFGALALTAMHTAISLAVPSPGQQKVCDPAKLNGTAALRGATQSLLGGIEVRNGSGHPCRLPNHPTLRLLRGNHLLAARQAAWLKWRAGGIGRVHVRVLAPGESAYAIVQWNGCSGWKPPAGFNLRATFELSLAGSSGKLLIPLADPIAEPCAFPGQPSVLSVSYFIPPP